jgi:hypothetical protein
MIVIPAIRSAPASSTVFAAGRASAGFLKRDGDRRWVQLTHRGVGSPRWRQRAQANLLPQVASPEGGREKGPAKSGASISSPRGSTRNGLAILGRHGQHLVAVKPRSCRKAAGVCPVIPLDMFLVCS